MKNEIGLNELFFDLIQVSIGERICLSRTPNEAEWGELYVMAKKQSLVGVCFAGVQKLSSASYDNANDDPSTGSGQADNLSNTSNTSNLSELQYLTWMGMAAKIQQRNEEVNRQCVDLQKRLSADGLRSAILKGQGVASIYSEHLRGLRQSGDIDVWVEGGLDAVLQLADKYGVKTVVAEHHVDLPVFDTTDVEAHFIPSYLRCPWHNKRLQKWMAFENCVSKEKNKLGMVVPTTEFNLVFLMLHAYRHLTSEGVGLRQVMDYYFALLSSVDSQRRKAYNTLCELGVKRFCGAMMYVLQEVFGIKRKELLCEPDEKEGRYLLNEIMTGGNFGHYDNRVKVAANETKMTRFIRQTKRNVHQLTHYPTEAFFSPWWRAKIWVWRKWNGWI